MVINWDPRSAWFTTTKTQLDRGILHKISHTSLGEMPLEKVSINQRSKFLPKLLWVIRVWLIEIHYQGWPLPRHGPPKGYYERWADITFSGYPPNKDFFFLICWIMILYFYHFFKLRYFGWISSFQFFSIQPGY